MQTLLITGATGFIGREASAFLAKKFPKWQIYCIQKPADSPLEESGRKILKNLAVKQITLDLTDSKQIKKLPKKINFIVHLAASAETSEKDHSFNPIAMKNILDHIDPTVVKHFIFTSTTAVWSGRNNFRKGIQEDLDPLPSNEYGRSKIMAEDLLLNWSRNYNIYVTILRLSTVFGYQTRSNGLFDALKKLIPQHSIIARLNWPGKTSLVYVHDVVFLLSLLIKTKPKQLQNLYIVYSESLTMAEISRIMHKAMKVPYRQIALPVVLWKLGGAFSRYFYILEFLPGPIYNFFWRSTLIVNSTLQCNTKKLKNDFPMWKMAIFKQKVDEVCS